MPRDLRKLQRAFIGNLGTSAKLNMSVVHVQDLLLLVDGARASRFWSPRFCACGSSLRCYSHHDDRSCVLPYLPQDDEPPLQVQLLIPPNTNRPSISMSSFTAEWAEVGVQIGDIVKVLSISSERLPVWVPVYLEDLLLPARSYTIVAAHTRVKTFHPELDDLRSLAFTGPRTSYT